MSVEPPIWITEAEIVSVIDLGEAIMAVRDGYAGLADGRVANMDKVQLSWGGGTLHATGAAGEALVGAKSWVHTAQGATPVMLLWRADDGSLAAVIEAFALGQYRTAAVSGVATDALAAVGAHELAMLGTGSQSLMQVAAVAAVRDIHEVRVWSPREESRARFAKVVRDALGLVVREVESPVAAADGAQVITLATRATEPFLTVEAVGHGTHVNAIGAISAARCEFDPKLLSRADVVVCDDIEAAKAHSSEFREFYGEGGWAGVSTLAESVANASPRADEWDITVFKAMGAGVSDLSVAAFAYSRARENNLGLPLPVPSRSRPRLRSSIQRPGVGYV